MLWKTHIRIANEILFRLGLPKSSLQANQLREGSIAPDKWKDYPHHEGKSDDIKRRLLNSRRFYLKNNLSKAYFDLGVALHYTQDGFTTLTSRSKNHSRWEQQIEQSYFNDNLQYIVDRAFQHISRMKQEYYRYIEKLSNDHKGKSDTLQIASMQGPGISHWKTRMYGKPYIDLNFALKASYIITKSVLSSKHNPELQKKLDENEKDYQTKLRRTETQTAKEMIELINKYNELKSQKNDGFFKSLMHKISTWTTKIRTNHNLNRYEQKKHLQKLNNGYRNLVHRITLAHSGWYNYYVVKLDVNSVQKELLTKQEIMEEFGIMKASLIRILSERNLSSYTIENKEFFRRSELKI